MRLAFAPLWRDKHRNSASIYRNIELHSRKARLDAEAEAEAEKQREKIEPLEAEEKKTGRKKKGNKPTPPEKAAEKKLETAKANTTDPDSRLLKNAKGCLQGYNA